VIGVALLVEGVLLIKSMLLVKAVLLEIVLLVKVVADGRLASSIGSYTGVEPTVAWCRVCWRWRIAGELFLLVQGLLLAVLWIRIRNYLQGRIHIRN
jgi:hypothetical protein